MSQDNAGTQNPGTAIDNVTRPDPDRPNAARMYDYYLGGSANFEVDREAAERQLASFPMVGTAARANRAFLGRAVRYLLDQGFDQFLDLGSGVPTVGNVHEIAHASDAHARVAYVDLEPVAVAHARRLLGTDPRVSVTHADLRRPRDVLGADGVAKLLDFSRPVAVLAVSVLHFVQDEDNPAAVLAAYRDACVPGSACVVSHISPVTVTPEQIDVGLRLYEETSTPILLRTPERIRELIDGYQLVEPGLVPLDQWRPDTAPDPGLASANNSYCAVGVLL